MGLTNREREFCLKIKTVLQEGRLFSKDDALGLCIMLKTDKEMSLMEEFLDNNSNATHDEILKYALYIKNSQE